MVWCGVVCRAPARRVWFVTERRAGERDQPRCRCRDLGPSPQRDCRRYRHGLAQGQIIRHDFVISNSEGQPLQIRRVTASAPCCSAVELQPKSIPAHSTGAVRVVLKPGFSSGYKSVFFDVETDSRQKPRLMLGLRARLLSEWEIAPVGELVGSIPIGREGIQTWRAITRRTEAPGGLDPPSGVEGDPVLKVIFEGPATERYFPGGIMETTRGVRVTIPKQRVPGRQQAQFTFIWPGGRSKTQSVRWETSPQVRLSPTSIVVDSVGESFEPRRHNHIKRSANSNHWGRQPVALETRPLPHAGSADPLGDDLARALPSDRGTDIND